MKNELGLIVPTYTETEKLCGQIMALGWRVYYEAKAFTIEGFAWKTRFDGAGNVVSRTQTQMFVGDCEQPGGDVTLLKSILEAVRHTEETPETPTIT